MKSLLNEIGSIALAIVLAVTVWVLAVNSQNPTVTQVFEEPVPLEKTALRSGQVLFGDVPDTVRLTVRAPRSSWNDLAPTKFKASIDLSNLSVGIHDVPVKVEVADPQITVVSESPATVSVRVELVKEKKVPVRVETQGSVPLGYETGGVMVEPSEVTVRGPGALVDQVSLMMADVLLTEQTEPISRTVRLQARDSNGELMSGNSLQVDPSQVRVLIPIEQRAGFRDLPVVVRREGQPAVGYRISNIRVEPATIKVFGSPAAISAIPGYVETTPINLEGKTSSVVERLALNLPETVSALEGNSVTVEVTITAIESSLSVQRPPTIQGLGDGLAAHTSLAQVDVLLAGPLPRLDQLRADDVRVVVDLRDLGPGIHKVEPRLVVPEGIRVESVLPKTIEVEIVQTTATPPPTLTATLAPTETPTATATPRRRL